MNSNLNDASTDLSRVVIATGNAHKFREFEQLLDGVFQLVSSSEYGVHSPDEDGLTFIENALIKARHTAEATGLPTLADDSGIVVPALDGAPGIYSARWAGPKKDFGFAMEKLRVSILEAGTHDTSAWFVCGLALAWPDGHVAYFEGRVDGEVVWPPRGDKGFGYDPMFVPKGHDITFGEMDPAKKHAMSHRADAFRQLVDACFKK